MVEGGPPSTEVIDQILLEQGLSLTELLNLDQATQQEILDKLGKDSQTRLTTEL